MNDRPAQHPPDEPATEGNPTEWRRRVLYHHRARTDLANERKYLGWLRVSLAMIALGFLVERLDLLLARAAGTDPMAITPALRWAPFLIFGMGALMIVVATWEFFADRRRIAAETSRDSRLLVALVWVTLASTVVVATVLALGAAP